MKTRIISGAVALVLLAGVLYAGSFYPLVVTVAIAALAVVAAWEVLHATGLVKNKAMIAAAFVYAALSPFVYSGVINIGALLLNTVFAMSLVVITLITYKTTEPVELCASFALTVFTSYALSTLSMLINSADGHGLFYFLLACAFAWGCDTGAYFTGVFLGKHKMCPGLSPKKTWEGAVGGVIIVTAITIGIAFAFNGISKGYVANVWMIAAITPFFAVIGMLGDLIASYLKRKVGIKDYGNLMPGHGGVLDRFDSLILIAPCFWSVLSAIDIITKI